MVGEVDNDPAQSRYFRLDDETRQRLSTAKARRFGADTSLRPGMRNDPIAPPGVADLPDSRALVADKG